MDREQIETLHEKASEHYLQGNYEAAQQAWTRLLEANPDDERALEGARLCEIMAQADATVTGEQESDEAAVETEVIAMEADLPLPLDEDDTAGIAQERDEADPELDSALSALDKALEGAGDEPVEVDEPAAADPGDGLDLKLDLDLPDEMQGSSKEEVAGEVTADQEDMESILADDAPGGQETEPASGLEPKESNPAERELERRINELLQEAAAADDDGRPEEALDILSRLFILDDSHEGARVLEETIREKLGVGAGNIDDKINEGVQLLESGDLESARVRFQEVLELSPDHAEAKHFLEQVDEMAALVAEEESGSDAAEDSDGLPLGEFPPESTAAAVQDHGNVELDEGGDALPVGDIPATPDLPEVPMEEVAGEDTEPSVEEVAPAEAVKSGGKGLNAKLIAAAAAVLVLGGFAYVWFGTDLLRGGAGSGSAGATQAAGAAGDAIPGTATGAGERSTEELLAEADLLSGKGSENGIQSAGEGQDRLQEALDRAQNAMDRGDYGAAVIGYNDAISIDPTHPVANAGLSEAGRLYRVQRMQYEELEGAKQSFVSGDYTSALKVLYRLPQNLEPVAVERYKFNSWYNLAMVAMKAGDTNKAIAHLEDALAIRPEDQGALEIKEVAESWQGAIKDLSYYAEVERLAFRSLED